MTRSEPHWLVNDADAKRYGQAMANAARHFPMKATQKAIDVGALIVVAFTIETPRVGMSLALAKQKNRPAPRGPAQVFQFVNPNAPAPPTTSGPSSEGAGASPPLAEGPIDLSAGLDAIGGEPAA